MAKLYVIGLGDNSKMLEVLKAEHPQDEIIVVNDKSDIPIGTKLENTQEIFKIRNLELDINPYINYKDYYPKGKKGYQRPYKYHR
jgi:hypothetical protein